MRRELGDGYELDDDRRGSTSPRCTRFISGRVVLGAGPRAERAGAADPRGARASSASTATAEQVGFCRASGDGVSVMYLADVYVLPEHRGRGLGVELVREMVERGPFASERVDPAHRRRARAVREVGFASR